MADKHDSGQMLLTGAFLIAVMIVIVSIMLNNIIYSSNVAYVGFMDGSKYEDMSIRHTTEKQIARTYLDFGGAVNDPRFAKCIDDYTRSVNYLVGQKGKYVELVPATRPAMSTLTTTETAWRLNVYNKDSKTTYNILTGEPVSVVPPSWPPTPVNLPRVMFEKSTYNVDESQNTISVTVKLSQTSTNDVSVNYKLLAGTATAGIDYTDATGTVIIPAGALAGTFTVAIIDDADHESTESLRMALETPVNAFLGIPMAADLFIADNDASGSSEHIVSFVTFTANRPDADKKTVKVRLVIRNDGADLNNVKARLIAIGSGGEVLDSKVSPAKIQDVGILGSGATSSELVWDILTQNVNDKLDISVQITADCSMCGLPIFADSGILAEI